MLVLRILLQIIFGLLSLVVGVLLMRAPNPDYAGTLPMLVLFIGIILVLGPWWPSGDKAQKWKLNLPTDDSRIAAILLSGCVAIYAFYRAWDGYMNPDHEFVRFEKTIVALLGRDGVAAAWIVIGLGCLGATIKLYRSGRMTGRGDR